MPDALVRTTAVAVLAALLSACGAPAHRAEPSPPTFAPIVSGPPATAPIVPSDVDPPASAGSVTTLTSGLAPAPGAPVPTDVDGLLTALVVAPEGSNDGYARSLFEHWIDADHNGCDTRCEVLNAERRTDLPGLHAGWLSLYDGYSTDDPHELDIDHVVALAEAWRSGAGQWDTARRRTFANDLDDPGALVAVTAATNRSKGDKDPARWQPPNRDGWCQWAVSWLRVKVTWGLTADPGEVDALRNILRDC